MIIKPIIFYDTVVLKFRVNIDPTGKPIILGYEADADTESHTHTCINWKLSFI